MPLSEQDRDYFNTPLRVEEEDLKKDIELLRKQIVQLRVKWQEANPDFVAENSPMHEMALLPGANLHNMLVKLLKTKTDALKKLQSRMSWSRKEKYDDEKQYTDITREPEQEAMATTISSLIKMADRFDQEGRHELAGEVDRTLKSLAARPKAPLKNIEDADLLNLYLVKSDNKLKEAWKFLDDMDARLRFFNLSDAAKDIKLDQLKNEISKVESTLDIAAKKFFELSHGRKPNKGTFEQMAKDFEANDPTTQSAQDFFNAQMAKDKPKEDKTQEERKEEAGICKNEIESKDEETISEDDLKNFWDADEIDDGIRGRMSPGGEAITNGTGGEGEEN